MATKGGLLLLGSALALSGCATASHGLPRAQDATYRWNGPYLEVSGVGKPDPAITNVTQGKALTREAALVMAQANLKAYAEKIRVRGRGPVGKLAAKSPAWAEKLRTTIGGYEVVRTDWKDDGSAVVVIRLRVQAFQDLKRSK